MYTLRRIAKNGVEMNFALGSQYVVVHEQSSNEEFLKDLQNYHGGSVIVDEGIYCFVFCEDGKQCFPLFKNQQAFIMTENGKTVSNLTHKSAFQFHKSLNILKNIGDLCKKEIIVAVDKDDFHQFNYDYNKIDFSESATGSFKNPNEYNELFLSTFIHLGKTIHFIDKSTLMDKLK